MDTQNRVLTVDQIRQRLESEPHLLTPAEASQYALIVSSNASRCRDALGTLEAEYAEIKCVYIEDGKNASVAKAMADGSEAGQKMVKLQQHLRGLEEIIKVLKKMQQYFHDEAQGMY